MNDNDIIEGVLKHLAHNYQSARDDYERGTADETARLFVSDTGGDNEDKYLRFYFDRTNRRRE